MLIFSPYSLRLLLSHWWGSGVGSKLQGFEGACVFLYPMPVESFKQLAPINSKGSGFIPSVELVFLAQFLEMLDGVTVMKMFGLVLASFFLSIIAEWFDSVAQVFQRGLLWFLFSCFAFWVLIYTRKKIGFVCICIIWVVYIHKNYLEDN